MTEDRDFKKVVRRRSAKTGESYQTARRQLDRSRSDREPTAGTTVSARIAGAWAHPAGLVLGCIVDEGRLERGMTVTLLAGDDVVHEGTVATLRVGKQDRDAVASGECGILLDPPFVGFRPARDDDRDTDYEALGALRPVTIGPMPDRLIG
jgi:translation initiation factor IF-2